MFAPHGSDADGDDRLRGCTPDGVSPWRSQKWFKLMILISYMFDVHF